MSKDTDSDELNIILAGLVLEAQQKYYDRFTQTGDKTLCIYDGDIVAAEQAIQAWSGRRVAEARLDQLNTIPHRLLHIPGVNDYYQWQLAALKKEDQKHE